MMSLVDTHSHLNFPQYNNDRDDVIRRTLDAGISIINVGCDYNSSCLAALLAKKYPHGLFSAVGLHPTNVLVGDAGDADIDSEHEKEVFDYGEYKALALSSPKVVAIGETGLDYYWLKEGAEEIIEAQKETFLAHINLAAELGKPVVIHVRDKNGSAKAHKDILKILSSYILNLKSKPRGVIHSFSGTVEQARMYRALGFKIAFNGIITFSRDYDAVVQDTPTEDILLETDCPFLTPEPHRGKRNEPLYVIEVAKKLAELKGVSYEDAVRQTTENAKTIFRLIDFRASG